MLASGTAAFFGILARYGEIQSQNAPRRNDLIALHPRFAPARGNMDDSAANQRSVGASLGTGFGASLEAGASLEDAGFGASVATGFGATLWPR